MNYMLPMSAILVKKEQETPDICTLHLAMGRERPFVFHFGQFNMLYLFGVGEVPISIMGWRDGHLLHTIRAVGRVTRPLTALGEGSQIGLRGPFGHGWPLQHLEGRDLVFITAGLGCAPVVAAIHYAVRNKDKYGRIVILQGVKHHQDLLWQQQYDKWRQVKDCQVLLAASRETQRKQRWRLGLVTGLLELAEFNPKHCAVMMCGPEMMMVSSLKYLADLNVPDEAIYMTLERNFQCGVGSCGHCQLGPYFVCKDGPVFHYPQIKQWFGLRGI